MSDTYEDPQEKRRAIFLGVGALAVALVLALVAILLLRTGDEENPDGAKSFSLTQEEAVALEESAGAFFEIVGTFGVPTDQINKASLNTFITNPTAVDQTAVGRAATVLKADEYIAPTARYAGVTPADEPTGMIYTVSIEAVVVRAPEDGFIDSAGVKTVVAPFTFRSVVDSYALPQESEEKYAPNNFIEIWDRIRGDYSEDGEVTMKLVGGKWRVESVRGLKTPAVLAINSGPLPYNPENVEKVKY